MESKLFGQIYYRDVPETRPIRSFIEKHVARWAEQRFSKVDGQPPTVVYHVSVKREGSSGHAFACHMRIRVGGVSYDGSSYSSGLHHTVMQCLARMRKQAPPRLPIPNLAAMLSAFSEA